MFGSFLKLSLRNLFGKNILFTVINILGLAMGLASILIVALFISDEYSFDRYHSKADRIYRVVLDFTSDGNVTSWAKTSAPIGQNLSGAFPEVEQVVRLRKNPGTDLLSLDELNFYENRLFFADSTLFEIFDFTLMRGNPKTALRANNSIVITRPLAEKFFGKQDPIGKTLLFNNQTALQVTGIMEEIPANSHFVADAFISFSTLEELLGPVRLNHWGQFDHYTYVLLSEGASPSKLEAKFPELLRAHAPEWVQEKESLFLQPLTDIHLHSARKDEILPNSREIYSFILGTIALFILFMASANFINLTTAIQLARRKEIMVQKILGIGRFQMVFYFYLETLLITSIALFTAFLMALLALPYFNMITGKQISILENSWLILPFLLLALVIGFLLSIIPSLQALDAKVLLSQFSMGRRGKREVRTGLITFQFFVSLVLVIATYIVNAQSGYLKNQRLGFESDQVIVVPVKDRSQNDRHQVLVDEIRKLPGVVEASYSSSTPGSNTSLTFTYSFIGTEVQDRSMSTFLIDEPFLDLYDIQLKEGRMISLNNADSLSDIIINEAAVRQLGLKAPIGQLVSGKVKGRVVGIVEDFNHTTLHSDIEPVIMYVNRPNFRFVSIKLKGEEVQQGITSLEKRWPELYPGYPLEFTFLDEQIQHLYSAELQLGRAYTSFSFIAILIAGIGLIGLSTYLMDRRRKEISIRKVFGSSTAVIVAEVYKGYLKIIIVAVLLSWAFTFYWMRDWLGGFAYRTELSVFHFVLPTLMMVFILLLSTGIQTYSASVANPVKNLRTE